MLKAPMLRLCVPDYYQTRYAFLIESEAKSDQLSKHKIFGNYFHMDNNFRRNSQHITWPPDGFTINSLALLVALYYSQNCCFNC